jgi:hypothetical protein
MKLQIERPHIDEMVEQFPDLESLKKQMEVFILRFIFRGMDLD